MAYMGMFHSDDSLGEYEDQFFSDYDLFEEYGEEEIEEEERYEADKYEDSYPEYWDDEDDYWMADEDDSFDLWLGGF